MTALLRADRRDDRGAAAVLVVAMAGVLLLVGSALGVVAAMVVAHRQAQAAADLAVLAGARDGCAAASRIALANGGELISCRAHDPEVRVSVRVDGPRWFGQTGDLVGHARAGPSP